MKQNSNGLKQTQAGWTGSFILSLHNSGSVATLGSHAVLCWKVSAVGLGALGPLKGNDPCSDGTAPSHVSTVEPVMPHQTFPGDPRQRLQLGLCKGRQLLR